MNEEEFYSKWRLTIAHFHASAKTFRAAENKPVNRREMAEEKRARYEARAMVYGSFRNTFLSGAICS